MNFLSVREKERERERERVWGTDTKSKRKIWTKKTVRSFSLFLEELKEELNGPNRCYSSSGTSNGSLLLLYSQCPSVITAKLILGKQPEPKSNSKAFWPAPVKCKSVPFEFSHWSWVNRLTLLSPFSFFVQSYLCTESRIGSASLTHIHKRKARKE